MNETDPPPPLADMHSLPVVTPCEIDPVVIAHEPRLPAGFDATTLLVVKSVIVTVPSAGGGITPSLL